ncbi:hypothetical protein A45J_0916 [hot springs metagenome]|uniref:Uncharacterized protein n=1 Tax=hot springs metagenome TaxID=433727 RepID=A0A5J4L2V7_9ZZZZ
MKILIGGQPKNAMSNKSIKSMDYEFCETYNDDKQRREFL